MREIGVVCVRNTAKQKYLKPQEPKKKKNILQQQFGASKPNEIWVSDVTCFKLNNRYCYVCVILDLFSRKIISYKISKKNSTQLIRIHFIKARGHSANPNLSSYFIVTVGHNILPIVFGCYFMNTRGAVIF